MVTLEAVAELCVALPEVTVGERWGKRTWLVAGKGFAWERPLSKADLKRLGDEPAPEGPIIAVSVEDLSEKDAVLAAGHKGFFTIAHFNGYPAVLIQLKTVSKPRLREALVDAWLAMAPPTLAAEHAPGLLKRR
jgi:hypothetical protein